MNKPGTLGQIGDLGGKLNSIIKQETKDIVKVVKSQVTGSEEEEGAGKLGSKQVAKQSTEALGEHNEAFVKEMYGVDQGKEAPTKEQAEMQAKTSKTEDAQKLQEIRALAQRLHKDTYYDPLVERSKPEEDTERSQERVERQEEEERKKDWVKQKEEEKKAPVSVQRAQRTTEMGKTSG
jgi:hypothetical protein